MSKYITIGTMAGFWFLLPFAMRFTGLTGYSFIALEELQSFASPSIANYLFIFIEWVSFYFRILTLSLPDAPIIISLFLFICLIGTGLAIISVFRGD